MPKTSDEIRSAFLDYFQSVGHEVVASGPAAIAGDPTLMFANAGMVQFKDVFTGKEQRSYQRAASSQKCIRISGKHNDLENVGPSPRHHTFFEMLGNFSFGDYFKAEAIRHAWTFIQQLGLPPERLVVTYFGGEEGIPADEEARELWKEISGLSDDRIIPCGMSENFWSMGDTGPCGPCTEIHVYQGPHNPDPSTFGQEQSAEGYGWMEIWNLVFMQFDRDAGGKLEPLPAPCVDTGMGLERIVSVLQDKTSNYETDLLRALVDEAAKQAGKVYGSSMTPDDISMRVIADHARLTAFLLAEGVMPDKNGREYVLRRVMRRAIRHGHRLGIQHPFLHHVALKVVELMGGQYPELLERKEHIAKVTEQEEVRFRATIERGLHLLELQFDEMRGQGTQVLDGRAAYKLYNTFGFPLDLTQVICDEHGFTVDQAGYDQALAEDRERSEFDAGGTAVEAVYREALQRVPDGQVVFTGYHKSRDSSELLAIIEDGKLVSDVQCVLDADGNPIPLPNLELVFARTPFYGESGGQVGDHGTISSYSGQLRVSDCQKPIAGLVVHRGTLTQGGFTVGDSADLFIDIPRREAIRRNHSATHLLHWALRQVLGSHAQQKGSLVNAERLRFDFTHGEPITQEQLEKIEDLVNERILANAPVQTELLSIEEAKQRGAMMLFGEKYDAKVRMLSMTESLELCGGTHARATGDIGFLKIAGEQSVAAGVRRITAATGAAAVHLIRTTERTLERAAEVVKSTAPDLPSRLEKMVQGQKDLEKKIAELQKKLLTGGGGGGIDAMLSQAKDMGGIKVLSVRTDVTDRSGLRELAEQLRDTLGNSVVMVASEADGKAQMVLTVARGLTDKYQAGNLIRPLATMVGGSGGGRADMAQAGGTEVDKLDQAVAALYKALEPGQLSLM